MGGDAMRDRTERIRAHSVRLPGGYLPNPMAHMGNVRDANHYLKATGFLKEIGAETALDIGSYDGWLDFLLIGKGFKVEGVELIPDLAAAARRYADRNFIRYAVHEGYFADLDLPGAYDAVMCFETLEHMPLDEVRVCAERMRDLAVKGVIVSLPDQDHRGNPQHLWTPDEDVIRDIWGVMPGFKLDFAPYPGTAIPGNYFITHDGGAR